MKRQLFLGAFLIGAFFTTHAQTIFSFETTEANTGDSYTAGSIDGQNYWSLYGETPTDNAVVTTEWASDGTQSLKLLTAKNYFDDGSAYGAYSPLLTSVITASSYEISQDIKTDLVSENGSNLYMYAYKYDTDTEGLAFVSGVYFDYSGVIYGVDAVNDDGDANTNDDVEIGTFEANTTYAITTRYNAGGNIDYYVNGEYKATVKATNGVSADVLMYANDDWDSSFFIDKIAYNTTLGVKKSLMSSLSVYPNPAKDVVNVANSDSAAINNVQITDVNGRIVKTANYKSVTNAQVNIADLASGVYIMSVTSDNGTTTKKIVKQ